MRKPLLAGNWKLNKTIKEAVALVTLLKRQISDFQHVDVVVCPPLTALSDVAEVLMDSEIQLGAQNIYWEENGAFTGEVSASLIKEAGCRFVIVGHSERRRADLHADPGAGKPRGGLEPRPDGVRHERRAREEDRRHGAEAAQQQVVTRSRQDARVPPFGFALVSPPGQRHSCVRA